MLDKIPVTVRIPQSLNALLTTQGKQLGLTKTAIIRISIHRFLKEEPCDLTTVKTDKYVDKPYRFVLNVNNPTNALLQNASQVYDLPVNVILLRVCVLATEYYQELLDKLGFEC